MEVRCDPLHAGNAGVVRCLPVRCGVERAVKPFPMICINAVDQELALKFGATYTVTGENGDCWYIDEFAQGGDFAKRRFIAPEQWPAWLDASAAYHLDEAVRYLDLLWEVAPDGRF